MAAGFLENAVIRETILGTARDALSSWVLATVPDVAPATAPAAALPASKSLTTLSLDTPPLPVASAPEVDSSRSALELPASSADAAPIDAVGTQVPAMTPNANPLADVLDLDAVIKSANFDAVSFFKELAKVPHIIEPSTSLSDRTVAMPTRDALESKVQMSMPALTDSASQSLGADIIDDVEAQHEPAREVCERPVSPPPQPQLITEE